jgi:hypothetical protein
MPYVEKDAMKDTPAARFVTRKERIRKFIIELIMK